MSSTSSTAIKIMGVLNVTPDSFSDGGNFTSLDLALNHAIKLIEDGADIIDVGGESTRPFADPVGIKEELNRVIPVIKAIRSKHEIPISIDTTKSAVARKAIEVGADIINDVSALRTDPEMINLVQDTDVPIIIMHMKGTPADMQIQPKYDDVVEEIFDFFAQRVQWIEDKGVDRNRLIIDPGIGFGKNLEHNLSILKHLDRFSALNVPVMLAHSRKKFLGEVAGIDVEADRDFATAVVSALSARQPIDIVRVHDVAATKQALKISAAIDTAL